MLTKAILDCLIDTAKGRIETLEQRKILLSEAGDRLDCDDVLELADLQLFVTAATRLRITLAVAGR